MSFCPKRDGRSIGSRRARRAGRCRAIGVLAALLLAVAVGPIASDRSAAVRVGATASGLGAQAGLAAVRTGFGAVPFGAGVDHSSPAAAPDPTDTALDAADRALADGEPRGALAALLRARPGLRGGERRALADTWSGTGLLRVLVQRRMRSTTLLLRIGQAVPAAARRAIAAAIVEDSEGRMRLLRGLAQPLTRPDDPRVGQAVAALAAIDHEGRTLRRALRRAVEDERSNAQVRRAAAAALVLEASFPSVRRGVVYARIAGRHGKRPLLVDEYLPGGAGARPSPGVLLVHGGGWRGGSRLDMAVQAWALAERGFPALSVDYRLDSTPAPPAELHDVRRALAWMRAHAGPLGVDRTRIAAFGASAGGQPRGAAGHGHVRSARRRRPRGGRGVLVRPDGSRRDGDQPHAAHRLHPADARARRHMRHPRAGRGQLRADHGLSGQRRGAMARAAAAPGRVPEPLCALLAPDACEPGRRRCPGSCRS